MWRIGLLAACVLQTAFSYGFNTHLSWTPPPPKQTEQQQRLQTFGDINQAVLPTYQYKMFKAGAFLNLDIAPKTMQKTMPGEEQDYFAFSNAGLNLEAEPVSWLMGHLGAAYYKTNKGQGNYQSNTGLLLDDAYILFADYKKWPLFFQVGQFYLPFGLYDRYTIVPTLPQMLEEARSVGIQFGVIDWYGVSATGYFVQGTLSHRTGKIQGDINGGASLWYRKAWKSGWEVKGGIQYIYNMLINNSLREGGLYTDNVYQTRVNGLATQGELGYGPLAVFADYVSALNKTNDLPLQYATLEPVTGGPMLGAQPSAWDVGARFSFDWFQLPMVLDANFQQSYGTNGLVVFNALPNHPFPETRYQLGFSVYVYKESYIRFQWVHNNLYNVAEGDTGRQGDNATLRFSMRV
jgi:hypothetical protein